MVALEDVESYLYEHIPITQAIGIKVQAYDGDMVKLYAPLEPNLNHRDTAFGGSLSTLGILSGWTLLHLKMREFDMPARLVIQKSQTSFIRPVESDFVTTCHLPVLGQWERFSKIFAKKGKSRLSLTADILVDDRIAATHYGEYVAIRTA